MTKIHIPSVSFDSWACYVHGTKFVVSESSNSPRTRNNFTVQFFDFNQNAVRRAVSQGAKVSSTDPVEFEYLECDESLCVTAPTVFRAGEIFRDEVGTYLPYRWIAKKIPSTRDDCATMCSEDSIIVVESAGGTGGRRYRVFSF